MAQLFHHVKNLVMRYILHNSVYYYRHYTLPTERSRHWLLVMK